MEESILNTIKQMLGIDSNYDAFDLDVIVGINSALMILNQIGIGQDEGFTIHDDTATWADLLKDKRDLESAKTFVYLKVKMVFDPPASSTVLEAMKQTCSELEWRLKTQLNDY